MKYSAEESSTLEWKREIPKNDQIIKTIIAFCNQNGGKIVIGVDNSGEIVGIDDELAQNLLESLEKTIYESCCPPILPRIYTQRFGEKVVLNIEVSSGMAKPYYKKSDGEQKGTFIRLGRSTLKATADIIEELKWQSKGIDYEALPNFQADEEDIDIKKIQDFLELRKSHGEELVTQSLLLGYKIAYNHHSKLYPTHAGLLLFGSDSQKYYSEAMIICTHFRGVKGRDVIATIDCSGTVFDQFRQSFAFITSRLEKSFQIVKAMRSESLEIPEIAIREILLNAIIHRNYNIKSPIKVAIYDDRIEFFSPGSFPGPIDVNNLRTGITYLRNPIICKIFREVGYVEKLGSGLITVFDLFLEKGLKEPTLIEGENYVKSILPRILETTTVENDIVDLLFSTGDLISIEDVQKRLKVSRQTAARRMSTLIEKGVIERIGKTRAVRYRRINSKL